jgi:hypothetical protein
MSSLIVGDVAVRKGDEDRGKIESGVEDRGAELGASIGFVCGQE